MCLQSLDSELNTYDSKMIYDLFKKKVFIIETKLAVVSSSIYRVMRSVTFTTFSQHFHNKVHVVNYY